MRTGNINQILDARYPRVYIQNDRVADAKLHQLVDCVDAARARPLQQKTVQVEAAQLRSCVLSRQIPFLNVISLTDPVLAVFPQDIKFGEPKEEKQPVSFRAHFFTDREMEVVNDCMPAVEPLLGEVKLYSRIEGPLIPVKDWVGGMGIQELYYDTCIHPLVLDEIRHLDLSSGDLVYEPGCGLGKLLAKVGGQYPHLNLAGSDIVLENAQAAALLNPGRRILQADAKQLTYLGLGSVSLFILCGLVNETVVSKEDGASILTEAIVRSKDYSYLVLTGKSPPLFDSVDLGRMGFFPVLSTKWSRGLGGFMPFYVCISPRTEKVASDGDRDIVEIVRIADEFSQEREGA